MHEHNDRYAAVCFALSLASYFPAPFFSLLFSFIFIGLKLNARRAMPLMYVVSSDDHLRLQ